MYKYAVLLGFLPLVAACSGTPATQGVQTAQECRMVENDDIGSKIKTRQVCTPVAQGGSADSSQDAGSRPAPQ